MRKMDSLVLQLMVTAGASVLATYAIRWIDKKLTEQEMQA